MLSDRNSHLLDLVDQALSIKAGQLDSWLDKTCGDDRYLRSEIKSLLACAEDAEGLLKVSDRAGERSSGSDLGVGTLGLLQTGTLLGDHQVEKQIGAGGMGVVYQAKQASLNRNIALKVLPSHLRSSPRAYARFLREVETAARLQHDNIVAVHTAGEYDGLAYYTMELIRGPSLNEIIAFLKQNPVPELQITTPTSSPRMERNVLSPKKLAIWNSLFRSQPSDAAAKTPFDKSPSLGRPTGGYYDVIAGMLAGVADGLDYAHRNEIVHRDVKPSNLLLGDDGRLHISDFGLARILSDPGMTHSGEFIGTPYYMAPEQLDGTVGAIDRRTDLYGLGATLYELLTLQPLYPECSRDQVLTAVLSQSPTPPGRLNQRVPRDLETICLKALEKQPELRYQSADQMADDLRRFIQRRPISAQRSGPFARAAKWCQRHPAMAASLLTAVSLLLTAANLAYRAHDEQRQRAVATQRASRAEQNLQDAHAAVAQANQMQQDHIFEAALLAAMQGDRQAVLASVREAKSLGGSPGRLHLLQAQVDMISANFDRALAELESAIKHVPHSLAAHALIAETYARLDNWSKSLEWLDKVRALEASSVDDLILRGRMESYHNAAAAEKTLDQAIAREKSNVVARLIRGTIRTQRAYEECDASHAERALTDLELAATFLEETAYIESRLLNTRLTASAAYEAAGQSEKGDQHLAAASVHAERLAQFEGDYEAHRFRAYYFERVGDLNQAIREWQAIEDKTIGYLIMCLYQAGRFQEALAACDRYGEKVSTGTAEFCHSFVLAATSDTADALIADLHLDREFEFQSNDAKLRRAHILWCLAGKPERAKSAVREVAVDKHARQEAEPRRSYMRGDIDESTYLNAVQSSRYELARASFVIGMRRLAEGDRRTAREHFQKVLNYRYDNNFFTAMSRALLVQLQRNPNWPLWVKEAKQREATQKETP